VSKKLENCNTCHLKLLDNVSTAYESFALVTLEPCLILSIGNVLFFKVFVPLHKAGAFSTFMNKVISKIRNMR
jgi:hypothetical protein